MNKTPSAAAIPTETLPSGQSLSRMAFQELSRRPVVWIMLIILVVLALMAIFPEWFTSADPRKCQLLSARRAPSGRAWFGNDIQGCDIYARTIYGTRASLVVALLAALGSTLIGGIVGLIAGFKGGAIDAVLSRITDIVMGLPTLLGAIVILSVLGNSGGNGMLRLALVLSMLGWATEARLMRASVLQVKEAEYIRAARVAGASEMWIALRHIVPNAITPLLVMATLSLGGYVGTEATLSYLGLGLQPPIISWGTAISDAQPYTGAAPHMLIFPSLFLVVTVLVFVLLGEAVRRAFDPRSR